MNSKNKKKVCFIHSEISYIENFKYFTPEEEEKYEIVQVLEEFTSKNFNLLDVYEKAKNIIEKNNCDVVFAPEEIMHLVSAVLEQTAIQKKPFDISKVLAEFFCDHKYYTRQYLDIDTCPYSYLDVESDLTNENIEEKVKEAGGFPVYLKPYFGYNSIMQGKAKCVEDVRRIMKEYIETVPPFFDKGIYSFFEKFLNVEKYPLFVKRGMIIEKFIKFKKLLWLDACIMNNKFYIVDIGDMFFDPDDVSVFTYCYYPSRELEIVEKIKEIANKIGEKILYYGMNNRYFNMEFMVDENNNVILQEINGRISDDSYMMIWTGMENGNLYLNLIKMLSGEVAPIPTLEGKHYNAIYYFYASREMIKKINYESFEKNDLKSYLPEDNVPIDFLFTNGQTIVAEKIENVDSYEEIVKNFHYLKENLFSK